MSDFQGFGQRDPQWAGDILLGGPDTIGGAGCLITVNSMVVWNAYGDTHYTPGTLNALFKSRHDYVGTDLLTDQALSFIWSDRFGEERVDGFDGSRFDTAIDSADTFVYLGLTGPGTHFVLGYGKGPNYLIYDPWVNAVGTLAGYTAHGWIVTDMVFVTRHSLPQPVAPQTLPKPTVIPVPHWYVEDEKDIVVLAPWTSLEAAKGFADQEAKDNPGHKFMVEDDAETEVYTALVAIQQPSSPVGQPQLPATSPATVWDILVRFVIDLIKRIRGGK